MFTQIKVVVLQRSVLVGVDLHRTNLSLNTLIDASVFSAAFDMSMPTVMLSRWKWSLFEIFDVTIVIDGTAFKVVSLRECER